MKFSNNKFHFDMSAVIYTEYVGDSVEERSPAYTSDKGSITGQRTRSASIPRSTLLAKSPYWNDISRSCLPHGRYL